MTETKFNEQQLEAINSDNNSISVIAGSGSGKSTIIVERIKALIKKGVKQKDILTVTFSRNSANDLAKKLNNVGLDEVNVGTFHSISARILLSEGINVSTNPISDWQVKKVFERIDKGYDYERIMSFINYQKCYGRDWGDVFIPYPQKIDFLEEELRVFYKAFEEYRRITKTYTYADWLIECLRVLKETNGKYRFKHVLADEQQDSNLIQNELLKEFSEGDNIFIVGDYRQAIYNFNGANSQNFMDFPKEYKNAKIINLYMNYRSCNNIVQQSNEFIRKYYSDYKHYKDAEAFNKNNGIIEHWQNEDKELEGLKVVDKIEKLINEGIQPKDICVLYRNNMQSEYIEKELKIREIDYDVSRNGSFFKRKEVEALIGFLRLVHNPHDDEAFDIVFKYRTYPLMYFKNKVYDEIKNISAMRNISFYESLSFLHTTDENQKKNIERFIKYIESLRLQHDKKVSVFSIVKNIIMLFKIDEHIENRFKNAEDVRERRNSVETLKIFTKDFGCSLDKFLKFAENGNTKRKKKKNNNKVQLMTCHASKGLEYDNVFLVGIQDGKFPSEKSNDIIEEANLFYVAITRAKTNLYVSEIGYDNRFIKEYFI